MNENLNNMNQFDNQNNLNQKSTGNTLPIIIIILLLVIIGLLTFMLLTKKDDKTNNGGNTENNTETNIPDKTPENNNSTNGEEKELDINSSLVQNLAKQFKERPAVKGYENKLKYAFEKANENNEELWIFEDKKINGIDYILSADSKKIEKEFKKIYGPDVEYKNVTLKSYWGFDDLECYYDSKSDKYYLSVTVGIDSPELHYFELIKATKNDEKINLYFYDYSSIPETDAEGTITVNGIISSNDKEYVIKNLYDSYGYGNYSSEEKLKTEVNKLKQEGKISQYKLTFTKQSDGNYYLNSGEWA